MSSTFRIVRGSLGERFQASRAKVQVFGGGFANGKTANSCIKALGLARDYPGSNGLIARATLPKLLDTIHKEFLKWCPKAWIKRNVMSPHPIVELTNGSTINFRYVSQQGKNNEASSSNLLSASYDWAVVDQIEDPEITHKDFDDILGRLRGSTPYAGEDPTMPRTGPRWFIVTLNPTRRWPYKKLIKPLHDLAKGKRNDDLIVALDDATGKPLKDDRGLPIPLCELFEGSTYENKANLEIDFIRTLEATYQGQMRDRFLLGKWAAYEGLVYPMFDPDVHLIPRAILEEYLWACHNTGYNITFFESFDYGLAVPSCYLQAFTDHRGNSFVLDGFYEKELTIDQIATRIEETRNKHGVPRTNVIPSDPAIFRRGVSSRSSPGVRISSMLEENGIHVSRADNDIIAGITKVQSYLKPQQFRAHAITGNSGGAYLYFASDLGFIEDEFQNYMWRKDANDEVEDKPRDGNDHAMDALRYLLTHRPIIATLMSPDFGLDREYALWHEVESTGSSKEHRYGRRRQHA